MKLLLFSDTHFVDSPTEEYRWEFLEKTLPDLLSKYTINRVICAGDLSDRRDRHSSTLVNRLISGFRELKLPTFILMGNHDGALGYVEGHYWDFLNDIPNLFYITKPYYDAVSSYREVLLLPFSPNPVVDWAELHLHAYKLVLMHQTIEGALIEGNRRISAESAHKLPILPRNIPIYSGDVHRPQKVGPIVYIGTPYPVRFGEDWPGRVLILDSQDYFKYQEIELSSIRRTIIDLNPASLEKLKDQGWKKGDQLRVRFNLNSQNLVNWPEDEARIKNLIQQTGASLLSVEAILSEEITTEDKTLATPGSIEELSPKETLRLFAKEENLSQELLSVGIDILEGS